MIERKNCRFCNYTMNQVNLGEDLILKKSGGVWILSREINRIKDILHVCMRKNCHYCEYENKN